MNASLSAPSISPASGKPAKQLIVFLHGYGADGDDLLSLAGEFADILPDAAFLSPHAPFPCDMSPMGRQWFPLFDRAPEQILAGVNAAAPILSRFLDEQLVAHGLADKDMALIGFSQGTMTALHTALRRPKPCAGIVGFSGALISPEKLPTEITARSPVCLIHGQSDPVVPFAAMGMAAQALAAAGVSVETHPRPGLPHGIDGEGIEYAKAFLKNCFSA